MNVYDYKKFLSKIEYEKKKSQENVNSTNPTSICPICKHFTHIMRFSYMLNQSVCPYHKIIYDTITYTEKYMISFASQKTLYIKDRNYMWRYDIYQYTLMPKSLEYSFIYLKYHLQRTVFFIIGI